MTRGPVGLTLREFGSKGAKALSIYRAKLTLRAQECSPASVCRLLRRYPSLSVIEASSGRSYQDSTRLRKFRKPSPRKSTTRPVSAG